MRISVVRARDDGQGQPQIFYAASHRPKYGHDSKLAFVLIDEERPRDGDTVFSGSHTKYAAIVGWILD
jgi:hypothetical protein